MNNMRIWDAVSRTDPAHTKKVEFGRKFTSIDAHWQIMQATRQFGPIGEGWGYRVKHSIATLAPDMILAVADVTIWWQNGNAERIPGTYGPIRATCEMWGKNEKKGRMEADEDAPKKAMTDALTKGLSHLGFSADVFLGLFDDNRYVQKMQKEFSQPADFVAEAQKDGLIKGDPEVSQHEVDRLKTARTLGWRLTNKTPKGQRAQTTAYLNMATTIDEVAQILKVNAETIATFDDKDVVAEDADNIIRYLEKQAIAGAGVAL